MEAFMPDFDCTGQWNQEQDSGSLACGVGLTGFSCSLKRRIPTVLTVICAPKEQPQGGFPVCDVQRVHGLKRQMVSCKAPTAVLCEVRTVQGEDKFSLTCQRA
jgi:hypothetical protein